MNQHPQQESVWTRFINWLLGMFQGSSRASGEGQRPQATPDQTGEIGSRLSTTATRLGDTADAAVEQGDKAWDHLLGKDEQAGASDVTSPARNVTRDIAGSVKDMAASAGTAASAAAAGATDRMATPLNPQSSSSSAPAGPVAGDIGSQSGAGAMGAGAATTSGMGSASSTSGSTADSDTDRLNTTDGTRQGGEDATAYARPGTPSSGGTTGADVDSLLGEQPGMGGPSPSVSTGEAASSGTTGIEREAAERARQHESSAGPSGNAIDTTQSGESANTTDSDGTELSGASHGSGAAGSTMGGGTSMESAKATGPAEQGAQTGQSGQSGSEQTGGNGGDESDRLTLLAKPPVAGQDVVIAPTSVSGFVAGETETTDTALDEMAESGSGDHMGGTASGTGGAQSSQSSYADAEIGLSDGGTDTESVASSPTPSGADAEFVAGTDIDWTSQAEWEELEEEAEISEPTGRGQATGTSSTLAAAGPSSSTRTGDTSRQSTGSVASDLGTSTAGQAGESGLADEPSQETQQSATGVGPDRGGPTATASDQATVPHGAMPGDGSRECPTDHPIKGNANSMIFHMPGQSSYDGTEPEYCFATEEDAVAAGYRASKARGRTDSGDDHADRVQESGPNADAQASGETDAATTGVAAAGASGTMSGEQATSRASDADVSTTPPAAVTSRPGTNQPLDLTNSQGQSASGSTAGASTQAPSSVQTTGTTASATQGTGAHRGSVAGDGSRNCPDDYPIKGNRNSMIYHMPHQSSYQGTKAEVCFATEDDAVTAGYRRRREGGEPGSDAHGHPAGSSHGHQRGDHGDSSTATTGTTASGTAAVHGSASGNQTGEEKTASASATSSNGREAMGPSGQSTIEGDAVGGSVAGDGTRDCPTGYPIKGNASSRIYHMPGQSAYDVTEPEFCFATEEAATSAGYRAAKR